MLHPPAFAYIVPFVYVQGKKCEHKLEKIRLLLFTFCLQRLFVAQTDNIETSSCIISPPQVKYESFPLSFFDEKSYAEFILTGCSFISVAFC